MSERDKNLTTEQKALSINLDDSRYGTVVEIGAGQEVARQFFSAGAASGTIAKTMSAYDMQISDDIYGKASRYVGRQRLEQMLKHEYNLLVDRLASKRKQKTTYFSYAATVSARGYQRRKEYHGWVGIRLQMAPSEPHNDIVMHVRMLDDENRLQSEALGILGANLIHSAFNYADNPEWIIESLLDNIGQGRIEVDLINFSGPAFEGVENRLMNLHLIRSWLTRAVMFDADGVPVAPRQKLYKRPVMVMRGSFKPPTKVHLDMVESGQKQFHQLEHIDEQEAVLLSEITMSELVSRDTVDSADFLARVDLLNSLGHTVLVSDYVRFFRLRSWLRVYTDRPIGLILSVRDFYYLFDEEYYDGLEGGILEAMGKLFPDNTHVFVYPAKIDGKLITLDNVEVSERNKYLLKYLIANKLLQPAETYVEENLHISAHHLIKQIPNGPGEWEGCVPESIAEQIRARKLFAYPGD
jgi:hypothetical protein